MVSNRFGLGWGAIGAVFLHLLVLGKLRLSSPVPQAPVPVAAIPITRWSPPSSSPPSSGGGGIEKKQSPGSPALSLRDLGVDWRGKGVPRLATQGGGDNGSFARSGRLLEEMRLVGLLERLQSRIESGLTYPREFQDARISGKVAVWIRCDKMGICPVNRGCFKTPHRFLRLLVWRLLEQVFEEPLPRSFRAELPVTLRMVFIFDLDRGLTMETLGWVGNTEKAVAQNFSGRNLYFEREGTVTGPLGMKKVRGIWMPTLSLDVETIYSNAKDWVEGKEHADPLDKWRLDSRF